MKKWLLIVTVVVVLLATSTGIGFWMLSDTKAELTSMQDELTGIRAELGEIKGVLNKTEEDSTPTYTLNVSVSPSGAGAVIPLGGEYEAGEQVTLTASPASGYIFDYWSDSISGTTSTINVTMDSDKTVTATFEQIEGVSCYEAKNHIGERITVYGTVVSTNYASGSSGKPTFLNMCYAYPDPNRFTVVIWGENRGKFSQPPEDYYLGKTIYVTGLIEPYDDMAEIEVTSPDQIHE